MYCSFFLRFLMVLEQLFWTLFIFGVSGGLTFLLGHSVGEKIFWLLGDLAAVAICATALSYYAKRVASNFHLFSWPALAILSSLWSLSPLLSLDHGVQLAMTMLVGLVLHERFGLSGLLKLLFFSLSIGLVLSILAIAAGLPGSTDSFGNWVGVYNHKNVLGASMVLLFFVSLALYLSRWLRGATFICMAGALGALAMSRSGAAIVIFALLCLTLPLLLAYRSGVRVAAFGACLVLSALAVIGLYVAGTGMDPVAAVLEALGKNHTLTGRTVLWAFAMEAYADHPIIGVGYKAYWNSWLTTSAYLRYFVQQDLWFFHNNFIEVAVGLGLVGLVAFVLGLLISAGAIMMRFLGAPTAENLWAVLFLVDVLVLVMVENPLFFNHSLFQVLFVSVAARASSRRTSDASATLQIYQPVGLQHWPGVRTRSGQA